MSAALVRKGLDLLLADDVESGDQTQSFKKRQKGPSSMKRDDLMQHIGTNKQGVKRKLRRLKRKENTRNKPTVMGKKIKPAIDVYYSKQSADRTEQNIRGLLQADRSAASLDSTTYEKIMTHSRGRMAKNNPTPQQEDTDTAFTEEDFELFEEEYNATR